MSAAPSQELDSFIDEKAAASLPFVEPPSYQATAPGVDSPPPSHGEPEQRRCCRRRCRRFGHFFVAAFFLWLGARFLLRHCELRRFGPHHWVLGHDAEFGEYDGHPHRPHHPHHDIDACVDAGDWSEYKPDEGHHHHDKFDAWRRTELSLSSSADDIFLLSKGFNAWGVLHLTEDPDREDIGIDVIVGFHEDSDAFEKTKVCTLSRGDKGHGLGILLPRLKHRPQKRDALFFNITVSLPAGADITTIPHFTTHLPRFAHALEKLPTHTFGSISLHTGHSPVHAEGLVGNKISIHSRRGPVAGTFNVSTSLDIHTCNSPVSAQVNAFNQDNAVPTKVRIHTSNGPLLAKLALISTHENKESGAFFVDTHTSNSPLAVNFTEQAADSLLKLKAHTSNSPAHVHLHPSFEGTFKLHTSIFHPSVVDEDVEDPAGRGRKRVVRTKSVGRGGRVVLGDAEWVPQDEKVTPHGKVEVSTTHSPLRLSL